MARTPAPLTTAIRPAIVRNEGQRMLLAVTGSTRAIASEIGCKSPQTVANWKAGDKIPSPEAQARMWTAFGIPPRAWSMLPSGGALESAPPAVPLSAAFEPPTEPPSTALAHCLELLEITRRTRLQMNLTPVELDRVIEREAKLLERRARLEAAAEFAESRYVLQHPSWIKLKRAILKALEKHPLAAKDVADAIAELEP